MIPGKITGKFLSEAHGRISEECPVKMPGKISKKNLGKKTGKIPVGFSGRTLERIFLKHFERNVCLNSGSSWEKYREFLGANTEIA